MAEFETDVTIDDIVVRDTRISSAVEEPLRAMILDMLAERSMTVNEVHADLEDRGFERTKNTIRHHINELREAGLVEVARLEEGRGGTTKYYEANTIVLSYTIPEEAGDRVEEMVEALQPEMGDVLHRLQDEYGEEIEEMAQHMAPCDHCRTQKYTEYILLTILRRSFVRAYQETTKAA